MKSLIVAFVTLAAIMLACNDRNSRQQKDDMSAVNTDSSKQVSSNEDKNVKDITPKFAGADAKVKGFIKEIVDHYLHIKNALVNDDESEAANGAKMLSETLQRADKSFFTPEQKKIYDENEDDLKEHAEHIGKSKLGHQREHFAMMSEDIYSLATAFGGGKTLYHDHCPMANDGKGAMWISEVADIKNPYMGKKMPTCGKVEEKIN